MTSTDSRQSYNNHVASLRARFDADAALRTAIGGEFIAMGRLECELLRSRGLQPGQLVVDVGCGSGRLAYQLAREPDLNYVGIDVVPALIDYAAQLCDRPDWEFLLGDGTTIAVGDGCADFVCFFSVFTHLVHEETYRYLAEARRVLKRGGQIIFSFLEFRIPCHWDQFQHTLNHANAGQHLNQFMDREAIAVWARHLGLEVDLIADGDRPHIPLPEEITFEQGVVMRGLGNLGQSVAVLRVP